MLSLLLELPVMVVFGPVSVRNMFFPPLTGSNSRKFLKIVRFGFLYMRNIHVNNLFPNYVKSCVTPAAWSTSLVHIFLTLLFETSITYDCELYSNISKIEYWICYTINSPKRIFSRTQNLLLFFAITFHQEILIKKKHINFNNIGDTILNQTRAALILQ